MRTRYVAALCAALTIVPAAMNAQAVAPGANIVAVERVKTVQPDSVLPSNSEVLLSVNSEVNSKKVKQGETFALSVARDVMVGDYIVIPRGTPATGQVSYRTGKGAFGKSAKIEIDMTGIDLNGRHIPIAGHYRIEGQGNTGAAVGAVVAVGVFGAFVTGRSAVVAQGAEYKAFTREALPLTLASAPSSVTPPAAAVPAGTAVAVAGQK